MELIIDPTFETLGDPHSPWHIEAHSVAGIAAQGVEGVCCIEIASPHEIMTHVEFRYAPFPVRRGQTLHVQFDAYAEQEMPFGLSVSEYHEPNRCLCSPTEKIREWRLGTEWQRYDYQCHIIHDEHEARLNFGLGAAENRVYLANLHLDLHDDAAVAA